MRVKRGTSHVKRRNRLLKQAKGYRWGRKNKVKLARVAVLKAGVHAYRDRRRKKRDFRRLWTIRLNAAAREQGLSYSALIAKLKKANIELDRKMLSELAVVDQAAFAEVIKSVQ